MHDHEPCGVDGCPALVASARGFCAVHEDAKRAGHVCAGTRCPKCKRLVEAGEWITRESTLETMTHAHCPPPCQAFTRKKDREKPLLDGERETEVLTSADVGKVEDVL
jgi:hypothetical protein